MEPKQPEVRTELFGRVPLVDRRALLSKGGCPAMNTKCLHLIFEECLHRNPILWYRKNGYACQNFREYEIGEGLQ